MKHYIHCRWSVFGILGGSKILHFDFSSHTAQFIEQHCRQFGCDYWNEHLF